MESVPVSERRAARKVNVSAVRGIMMERKREIEESGKVKDDTQSKDADDLVAKMAKKNEAIRKKFELARQDKLAAEKNNCSISSVAKPSSSTAVDEERAPQEVACNTSTPSTPVVDSLATYSSPHTVSPSTSIEGSSPIKPSEATPVRSAAKGGCIPGRGRGQRALSNRSREQRTPPKGPVRSVARVLKPGGMSVSPQSTLVDQVPAESSTSPMSNSNTANAGPAPSLVANSTSLPSSGASSSTPPLYSTSTASSAASSSATVSTASPALAQSAAAADKTVGSAAADDSVNRAEACCASDQKSAPGEKSEAERRQELLKHRMGNLFGSIMAQNATVKKDSSVENKKLFSGNPTISY